MNIKDLIDTLFKLVELINFEWNIHLVVVVAFVGWFLSLKDNQTKFIKAIAYVAFIVFMSFNIVTLLEYYSVYKLTLIELKASINTSTFNTSEFYEKIQDLTQYRYQAFVWGIHLPIDFICLFFIGNDNLWRRVRNR